MPLLSHEVMREREMTLRSLAVIAAAVFTALGASAQTYTVIDRTPVGWTEAFFNGAGGSQGVGTGSFPVDVPGIPDARATHAFVWDNAAQSFADLHPGDAWSGSFAFDASAGQQVGFGFTSGPNIALLWTGSAESFITLDTPGTVSTVALATDGITQVGSALTRNSPDESRAFLWNGTAASGRELAFPNGFAASVASGVRGSAIVGTGDDENFFQAGLYWANDSASPIIVRPNGFEETRLNDVDGNLALGSGFGTPTDFQRHAFLWDVNSIENGLDLHPTDSIYTFSDANALLPANESFQSGVQVGIAAFENDNFEFIEHAAVWFGSAESFIDLHDAVVDSLGPEFRFSRATGIGEDGTIYGTATDGLGSFRAVQWNIIPSPSSALICLIAAGTLGARSRSRSSSRTSPHAA